MLIAVVVLPCTQRWTEGGDCSAGFMVKHCRRTGDQTVAVILSPISCQLKI